MAVVVVDDGAVVEVVVVAGGPVEMMIVTTDPGGNWLPAGGFVPMTLPASNEVEDCCVSFTLKPCEVRLAEAVAAL